jgi:hypothetical protein
MGQAPDPRATAGAGCEGWVVGRLDEQRCLRTRVLLPNVPEAWDNTKLLRQVHCVRRTRRVTVRKTPVFLSLDLSGQSSPGSPYLCGRPSVRALHVCDCATHMCNKQDLDFMGVHFGRSTYPILLANPHVRFYWTFSGRRKYRCEETSYKVRKRTSILWDSAYQLLPGIDINQKVLWRGCIDGYVFCNTTTTTRSRREYP